MCAQLKAFNDRNMQALNPNATLTATSPLDALGAKLPIIPAIANSVNPAAPKGAGEDKTGLPQASPQTVANKKSPFAMHNPKTPPSPRPDKK